MSPSGIKCKLASQQLLLLYTTPSCSSSLMVEISLALQTQCHRISALLLPDVDHTFAPRPLGALHHGSGCHAMKMAALVCR